VVTLTAKLDPNLVILKPIKERRKKQREGKMANTNDDDFVDYEDDEEVELAHHLIGSLAHSHSLTHSRIHHHFIELFLILDIFCIHLLMKWFHL